ncbi:MAG TPA: carboxypeptidase-like regulatory domain-containing protein [Acidobacteriota bacterium]|jgi:hypothetical protein
MTKFKLHFQIGAIVFLAIFAGAFAQVSSTSSIHGTVRDNSGSLIPGAELMVTNMLTGAVQKAITNDEGSFTVPALPVGVYKVAASVPGFNPSSSRDRVRIG